MWSVYLLQQLNGSRTYVGATLDVDRRLRQHNGELSGGAKATSGSSWKRICYIANFPNERSALQFEWAWKHTSKKQSGNAVQRRIKAMLELFGCEKPTSKADDYQTYVHDLAVMWEEDNSVEVYL
jgi:structure-specific endonuclease subunit SLX1